VKHLGLLVALLALVVSACCVTSTTVSIHPPQAKATSFTTHVDTAFTPAERAAIVEATKEWERFSSGRVHIEAVFDLDFDSVETLKKFQDAPIIVRAESWMSILDDTPQGVLAWTNGKRQIVLIVDRIPSFKPVIMHEMGHAAGLAWPDWCPADAYGQADCNHSPDLDSIMSARYRGVQAFTDADRAFCRASGYCP